MSTKYKQKFCKYCNSFVRAEKPKPSGIFHFIMIVITLGMWSFLWALSSVDFLSRRYQCPRCGGKLPLLRREEKSMR